MDRPGARVRALAAVFAALVLASCIYLLYRTLGPDDPVRALTRLNPDDFVGVWNSVLSEEDCDRGRVEFGADGSYTYYHDSLDTTGIPERGGRALSTRQGRWEIVDSSILRVTLTSETYLYRGTIYVDKDMVYTFEGDEYITTPYDPEYVRDYDLDDLGPMYARQPGGTLRLASISVGVKWYIKDPGRQ